MTGFGDIAVLQTACSRPGYLRASMASWASARHISEISEFLVALGRSEMEDEQRHVIAEMCGRGVPAMMVLPDSDAAAASRGMHRAIAEAATWTFEAVKPQFLVFTEEDVVVSDDVLEYMAWAAERFAADKQVLAVCAHSKGGQGWDEHSPAQDAGADQAAASLLPYFNAWTFGTWADRWREILEPEWDYECDRGGPATSGWDWGIQLRSIPAHKAVCVVPHASRSQNIGEHGGWASNPYSWSFSQAQSFRAHRDPAEYRLVEPARTRPW